MRTPEEYNALIGEMHKLLESSPSFFEAMQSARSWAERQIIVARVIEDNRDTIGGTLVDALQPWVLPRLMYEMQQNKGEDFGYCQYFKPNFEKAMRENIAGQYTSNSLPLCTLGTNEAWTTCDGLGREYCVLLKAEREKN